LSGAWAVISRPSGCFCSAPGRVRIRLGHHTLERGTAIPVTGFSGAEEIGPGAMPSRAQLALSHRRLFRSWRSCGLPLRHHRERTEALPCGTPAGQVARSASLADAGWSQAATAVLAWSLQSGGPTYRLHVPEPRFPVPSFLIRREERPEQPHERLGMNRLADEQSPLR
jgi:hypothetical protein